MFDNLREDNSKFPIEVVTVNKRLAIHYVPNPWSRQDEIAGLVSPEKFLIVDNSPALHDVCATRGRQNYSVIRTLRPSFYEGPKQRILHLKSTEEDRSIIESRIHDVLYANNGLAKEYQFNPLHLGIGLFACYISDIAEFENGNKLPENITQQERLGVAINTIAQGMSKYNQSEALIFRFIATRIVEDLANPDTKSNIEGLHFYFQEILQSLISDAAKQDIKQATHSHTSQKINCILTDQFTRADIERMVGAEYPHTQEELTKIKENMWFTIPYNARTALQVAGGMNAKTYEDLLINLSPESEAEDIKQVARVGIMLRKEIKKSTTEIIVALTRDLADFFIGGAVYSGSAAANLLPIIGSIAGFLISGSYFVIETGSERLTAAKLNAQYKIFLHTFYGEMIDLMEYRGDKATVALLQAKLAAVNKNELAQYRKSTKDSDSNLNHFENMIVNFAIKKTSVTIQKILGTTFQFGAEEILDAVTPVGPLVRQCFERMGQLAEFAELYNSIAQQYGMQTINPYNILVENRLHNCFQNNA